MNTQPVSQVDAERAMHIAFGAASPLWFLYAGAGAAGAAFYWMSRWSQATNIEALMGLMSSQAELAAETAEAVADAADPVVESMPQPLETALAAMMPEPTAEAVPDPEPDDLTQLKGVGPKLAVALAERGITRFADVAALSADVIADLDADLRLMGRIDRDDWVGQAKGLA